MGRGRLELNLWLATGLGEFCCTAKLSDLHFGLPSNKQRQSHCQQRNPETFSPSKPRGDGQLWKKRRAKI